MTLKKREKVLPLLAIGTVSGVISGLLGAGGGVPLTLSLQYFYKDKFGDARDLFANSLCALLPMTAAATAAYWFRGRLVTSEVLPQILPSLIGGIAGGLLVSRINPRILRIVFGTITVWSGFVMLFK